MTHKAQPCKRLFSIFSISHIFCLYLSITDPPELYSGCYARASINFYPFNTNGNRGVAAGLGNVQKWADGEPLNGRVRAEDEFGALDDVDDDDFLG
ncbi:MAG: DUF2815 family protein [Bacteroidales bacterium]